MKRLRHFPLPAWLGKSATRLGFAFVLRSATAFPFASSYQGAAIQNGPDPSITVVKQENGETDYYMYCSNGPLNDKDRDQNGKLKIHLLPIFHSTDLVNWKYLGDVFEQRPEWAGAARLIGPEIQRSKEKYFLYYTAVDEDEQGHQRTGGAIGVVTSASPAGPWADSGQQVVEVQNGRWVYDPCVIEDAAPRGRGQRYLFYGSYVGGLFARKLSTDGLSTDPASEVQIALPDRYEATFIWKHDDFYYLFVSSSNCCNVEMTGYSVLVGRSTNLLGPYLDRTGASFLESRAGGTPVLSANGNRWIGPGHNTILTDYAGQDWFAYAAVDRTRPSFAGENLTARMPMLDPLDWVEGWPTVRGGFGASDKVDNKPAAQPGDKGNYRPVFVKQDKPGDLIAELSDEFDGSKPLGEWAAGRVPEDGTFGLRNGAFSLAAQPRDLREDHNDASVLTEPAPPGDYAVEIKLHFPVPADFSNHAEVQAGLILYRDDDNYLKLVHRATNGTRQIEFARETAGGQRYGNIFLSPPSDTTYLRIVKRSNPANAEESYTAYVTTQSDSGGAPANWIRGGTWTNSLGGEAKIGLVSMGGSGITAEFDYLRVTRLRP